MARHEGIEIKYFRPDGVPGRYFACPSYGTMSVASCARNFTDAPQSAKAGRLQRCVDCAIGRKHTGVIPGESASARIQTSILYRKVCLRCRRDGRNASTRLIGRIRLVRGHTICVSCYNREREVLHGANAKGAAPKKWSGLFSTRSAYLTGTKTVVVAHPDPVADRIELALTLMRRGHDRGVVWAPPAVIKCAEAGA